MSESRFDARIKFTPEMVERVRVERGKARPTPWVRVAQILGVGTGTIMRWAYTTGVETDPQHRQPKAFAAPGKSEGLRLLWLDPTVSQEEIARRLGVHTKSLVREAVRLGLGPRPPRVRAKPQPKPRTPRQNAWPQAKLAKLRVLVASGRPYTDIGLQLGVSKSAAIGMSWRMGLERREAA